MPFEIAPQFVPAEVEVQRGPFWADAEAMLLGASITRQAFGEICEFLPHDERRLQCKRTCAIGALRLGLHGDPWAGQYNDHETDMELAYSRTYGTTIRNDNDDKGMSREQISERVRALR